jgi:hypothetical protein
LRFSIDADKYYKYGVGERCIGAPMEPKPAPASAASAEACYVYCSLNGPLPGVGPFYFSYTEATQTCGCSGQVCVLVADPASNVYRVLRPGTRSPTTRPTTGTSFYRLCLSLLSCYEYEQDTPCMPHGFPVDGSQLTITTI